MSLSPSDGNAARGPVIRPARRADIDALVAIENASFTGDRLSRRSFLRLVESPTAIALVADADEVLGGCITLLRAASSRARLYSLAVAPMATGRGIGSSLLDAAEKSVLGRGIRTMTLEVRQDNEAARSLYAKRGFALVGTTPGYYGDGEAALHMRKHLIFPSRQGAAA